MTATPGGEKLVYDNREKAIVNYIVLFTTTFSDRRK
jgi:hypothetical protein